MKKTIPLFIVPLISLFSLSAQITQQQADEIVIERMSNDTSDFTIYAQKNVQTGFEVITSIGETLELDYLCWVYYIDFTEESNSKYLIVKESNGNLLEINTKNDEGPNSLENWRIVIPLAYSVWECVEFNDPDNIFIELRFYPSVHLLQIVTIPEQLPSYPLFHTMLPSCILDYYIENDEMHWIIPEAPIDYFWKISYSPDDVMFLKSGLTWPGNYITGYHFICKTIFNEI